MKLILTGLLIVFCLSPLIAQSRKVEFNGECRCWIDDRGKQYSQFDSLGRYSKANFGYGQFDSSTDFDYRARFDSEADFNSARFNSEADFFSARFNSDTFNSDTDFQRAQFASGAFFRGATFDSANFRDTWFGSESYFDAARFNSDADFRDAQFDSKADFYGAQFGSVADFGDAKFGSVADFRRVQFDLLADFFGTQFNSLAYFSYAQFNSDTDFINAILPDTLLFLMITTIAKEIDLTVTKLDSGKTVCFIDLTGSNIEKLKLDYGKFNLYWSRSFTSRTEKRNIYERLLRKFQLDGFLESFELLSIEYAEFNYTEEAKASGIPFYWHTVNWLDKNWWNYGYNKEQIFRNTGFILFLFVIINLILFRYLNNNVYKLDGIWEKYSSSNGKMGFINKFFCALAYTGTIFFGLKFNYDKIKYHNWAAVVYFYAMYISGLVCLAYLFNFVISN
ncbi:MAG TPA: pentapeptide repeat-containing protein [bacterium]|nr:pentapeptide repeat-containing protein [bacterium]